MPSNECINRKTPSLTTNVAHVFNLRIYSEDYLFETKWSLPQFKSEIFAQFKQFLMQICRSNIHHKDIKWQDDEGNFCTLSNDLQLLELIRCTLFNKKKLATDKFEVVLLCNLEQIPIRRLGHYFQLSRINRHFTTCVVCNKKMRTIGYQWYRCISCELRVHRKCHLHIKTRCYEESPTKRISEQSLKSLSADSLSSLDSNSLKTFSIHNDFMGLRQYNILNVIGRGSYAKVFKVRDNLNDKVYAMKVIKKSSLIDSDGDYEWVQTEKHVMELARSHPFLVGMQKSFQTDFHVFLIMDFVNGGDLMFHMQRLKKLSENHARFYCAEIAIALNFLHKNQVLYRDLKLDNVMLDFYGHVRLTDYGMCKENLSITQKTNTFCGTPNYIAPEMLTGQPYGFSVDWWALGILAYEMMVGRSPFCHNNDHENSEDYLFQLILNRPIRIPRFLSAKAMNFLHSLLDKDESCRLGCVHTNHEDNLSDIKLHPFFKDTDFETIHLSDPPFKPPVANELDIICFDDQFTKAPVLLTPENSFNRKQTNYGILTNELCDDFEFVNDFEFPMESINGKYNGD